MQTSYLQHLSDKMQTLHASFFPFGVLFLPLVFLKPLFEEPDPG